MSRKRTHSSKNRINAPTSAQKKAVLSVAKREQFSGPIPHPEIMQQYERIVPGAADRIITMAEKQSEHRMSCEKFFIDKSMRQSLQGQIFAFVICFSGIVGGVILLAIDKPIGGLTTFVGSIFLLAGVFIRAKKQTEKSINEKKENDSQ